MMRSIGGVLGGDVLSLAAVLRKPAARSRCVPHCVAIVANANRVEQPERSDRLRVQAARLLLPMCCWFCVSNMALWPHFGGGTSLLHQARGYQLAGSYKFRRFFINLLPIIG